MLDGQHNNTWSFQGELGPTYLVGLAILSDGAKRALCRRSVVIPASIIALYSFSLNIFVADTMRVIYGTFTVLNSKVRVR